MLKGLSKLKTNTIGLLKTTLFLKPIVLKPGIVYRIRYAISLIFLYYLIYFIPSIFFIKLQTKQLFLQSSFFLFYLLLFFISAFFYKKVQKGPYHFNKYLIITVVSNLFLPIAHFLFLFNMFFSVVGLFFNLICANFFTYINFTYLTFWEGKNLLLGYMVIFFNNFLINFVVLIGVKIMKLRK